jgi:hypothetical protein
MTAKEFIERLEEVNWEGNKLPCNLTVGGWLNLRNTNITSLPDNLTVGGGLYLQGTNITSLPDNLTVGGGLYLGETNITSLPNNLTVGGWLDLQGTNITSLPNNLTVGGGLNLGGTNITSHSASRLKHVKKLKNGDITDDYIYADNMLTHIKTVKKVNDYTLYIAPYPEVVATKDHKTFAHGRGIREAIQDLTFKLAKRDVEDYRSLSLESELTYEEAVMMYRVITGACRYGVNHFLEENSIEKKNYTVGEILELTHGQYGHEKLKDFFMEGN